MPYTLYQLGRAQTKGSLDGEKLLRYYQAQEYTEAAQYELRFNKDSSDVNQINSLNYGNFAKTSIIHYSGKCKENN